MTFARAILDITRLIRRVGRGPLTGIDRVELAWLTHLLSFPDARFFCRTTRGYLLLDDKAAREVLRFAQDPTEIGRADLLSRLVGRGHRLSDRVEAALRPHMQARCLRNRLAPLMREHFRDSIYVNVGHTNLDGRLAAALPSAVLRLVMLHDTIPMDLPELVRPAAVRRFHDHFKHCLTENTQIVTPSAYVADRVRALGYRGTPIVAPLGVDHVKASVRDSAGPSFVVLGTIETRKNQRVLLEAWSLMDDPPPLHLIGRWGWCSDDLRTLLDTHPLSGRSIFEHNDLSDHDVQSLLSQATALLMPSLGEGFGLPPLEAARLGVPSVVSDLPVFRETLGSAGIYLDPNDAYAWGTTIRQLADGTLQPPPPTVLPTWQAHFQTVERALS